MRNINTAKMKESQSRRQFKKKKEQNSAALPAGQ
jgi:hypothetical protein